MESLLDEKEVLSRHTRITAETGHSFLSDCCIALNFLHEFSKAVVVVVPMESLVIEEHGLARQTEKQLKRAITFDLTVGSRLNFYRCFWMLFSLLYQGYPYSMRGVLSRETGITAEKGYNFWFDRWIALNVLHEFPDAVLVVVPMESLVVEEYGLSRQTKTTAKKGYNF